MTDRLSQSATSAGDHQAEDRAATGTDDSRTREPRLQRAYEREWKRHPAQIELLQTIVLRLDRLIELLEDRDA